MSEGITIRDGGAELLDEIEPLWKVLRSHHAGLSVEWRESLLVADFADRRAKLIDKGSRGLRVFLAMSERETIGYCVCTIAGNHQGEIDSIFVADEYRHHGMGKVLMAHAMDWLKALGAAPIVVDVLAGNEEALRFYEQFDFCARTIRLQHKD